MNSRRATLHLRLALIYAAMALLILLFTRTAHAAAMGEPLGTHMYYRIAQGEDLYDIAQKYDIGIGELRAANPRINESHLKVGQTIVLPTAHLMPDVDHSGIVINLPERRLYYFDAPGGPVSFPVTVGKEGWETPTGATYIANKRENPTWTVPDKIRAESPELPAVVPPGPDNPLGKYAMDLGFSGIRIHGTNNPKSIGRQSSHGCIRMYPADIEKLFNMVPLKTKVTIINQPYKIGWHGGQLLLEVAPPAAGSVARSVSSSEIREALNTRLTSRAMVDWSTVDVAIKRRDGMPISIGRSADGVTQPAIQPAYAANAGGSAPYYAPQPNVAVMHSDASAARVYPRSRPAFTPYTVRGGYRQVEPTYVIQGRPNGGGSEEYVDYYGNNDEQ
jgi:L,D-transpeptidase ErfK/SrfK